MTRRRIRPTIRGKNALVKIDRRGYPTPVVSLVALIGCGGTGSILAEHLARLIAGHRLPCRLALIDGDVVAEANIVRQNFHHGEIGLNKAEALAFRLGARFGLEILAVAGFLRPEDSGVILQERACLTLSATDSVTSRALVAQANPALWLDVGNELAHGQAILGTTSDRAALHRVQATWNRKGHQAYPPCLPNVAAVDPVYSDKAALARARRRDKTRVSCADEPFAHQGAGVNAGAALAAATIAKQILVDHMVTIAQIWFDVAAGFSRPVPITRDLFSPWAQAATAKKVNP